MVSVKVLSEITAAVGTDCFPPQTLQVNIHNRSFIRPNIIYKNTVQKKTLYILRTSASYNVLNVSFSANIGQKLLIRLINSSHKDMHSFKTCHL